MRWRMLAATAAATAATAVAAMAVIAVIAVMAALLLPCGETAHAAAAAPEAYVAETSDILTASEAGETEDAAASEAGTAEDSAAYGDDAASVQEMQDFLLDSLETDRLERFLKQNGSAGHLDFQTILREAMDGDFSSLWEYAKDAAYDAFLSDTDTFRKGYAYVIFLGLAAAVFTNLSSVLREGELSGTGFFLIYLSMAGVILGTFQICCESLEDVLGDLVEFMRLLSASFSLSVGLSNGSASAAGIYAALLFGIWIIETAFVAVLIPLIHLYMAVTVLDQLSKEPFLERFGELIKSAVGWILKTGLGLVTGMNLVQGLTGPAADALRRTIAGRTAEAIPGIGDALAGTGEVLTGTAALIRNGLGVAGMLVCLLICLIPALRFFLFMLLFRLAGAALEPIADKRIARTLTQAGYGYGMLLRLSFSSGVLFLLSVAVVIATL